MFVSVSGLLFIIICQRRLLMHSTSLLSFLSLGLSLSFTPPKIASSAKATILYTEIDYESAYITPAHSKESIREARITTLPKIQHVTIHGVSNVMDLTIFSCCEQYVCLRSSSHRRTNEATECKSGRLTIPDVIAVKRVELRKRSRWELQRHE